MSLTSYLIKLNAQFKKGFTLIELLIVVAIIGILSGLIITNIQGVRQRARDARRKSDLEALTQSLRLYYNDQKEFPNASTSVPLGRIVGCGSTGAKTACSWGTEAFQMTVGATNVVYMNRLPYDPSSTVATPVTYTYASANDDTFLLTAILENPSDPDIAESKARCGVSTSGNLYVVCP